MGEAWRELRAGDRIRFVALPSEWDRPGFYVHSDTRRLVRRLIERGRSLRVCQVDEWGVPWVACRFCRPAGNWEYHDLGIFEETGWVRVRPRR